MVKQFLPHLKSQGFAAIVNVSSGLAFVPLPIAPIYCAAKAGVHSFTQSLRVQLRNTRIKVFELAPPMTRTPLFAGDIRADDVKGIPMMDVSKMVSQAIKGLERDQLEIRPGLSNVLKLMSRLAPQFILNRLSRSVEPRGNNGVELVKKLSASVTKVRAFVRSRAQARIIDLPGVELAEGDFAQPKTFELALKGVDRLFLLIPSSSEVEAQQRNFVGARIAVR
jgi:hypothetical protein